MTIRVGIIGCGKIAHLHAEGYRLASDLAEVVVCSDDWSIDAAHQLAATFPNATAVDNWQAVIERDDVDAVSVCMPHDDHLPIALAAARAGKHMLIEKPFALNLDQARQIVDAADQAGKVLMVGQNQRFMEPHRHIKDLLDQEAIGKIVAVRFDCNQFVSRMYPPESWMFSKERTGGGMVISTAVHKLDLLRWFFGEIRQVSSFQATTSLNYQGPNPNEDVATILLEFENGILGEGFYLFAAHKTPIPTTTGELTIIYGEEGIIHNVLGWHIYSTKIPEYSGGETKIDLHNEPYVTSVVREIQHFVTCIHDGSEPLTSGRDNLNTMATIDAIYRSAERKTVEQVGAG
jgi:predicted dehydrogenase